jgi:transglutaminase-like putative cysteine protease
MHIPEAFLAASDIIDADDPAIRSLAASLKADRDSPEEIAASCFAWVRDRIPHTFDLGHGPVTCVATDVLRHGTGICFAKSHLLAALLRANSIAAGLCYQRLSIDDQGPPFTLHGMVAVHLGGHGWYRCDPRGGKPGAAAAFTPPVEALAYVPKLPGEGDIPGVFAEPLPEVVGALRDSRTLEALKANPPDIAVSF